MGGGDGGALRFRGRKGSEQHPVPVPASPLGARSKTNGQKRIEGPPLRLATGGGTAGLLGVLCFGFPPFLEASPGGALGGCRRGSGGTSRAAGGGIEFGISLRSPSGFH